MKRVRMLLRVSSNQQLDCDGDLSVQRRLVLDYIAAHDDWVLDEKEYYEGSNSGYRNAVSQREILQEALGDAEKREYDILAVYKDDRIGRRMWEIGAYVMRLKSCGVDIYTVKDGCISPENGDIMGQMMLALRYGNAQKSSSDTGMRVKDTAEKLIQQGKFMGGMAPYGYRLIYSGQISKHGRALHKLEIIPAQADTVKYIYHLSCHLEFGSAKIAKLLNEHGHYRMLAPIDVWKAGAVSSILKNPIYAGYTAYKRRERINGSYHRLDSRDWIKADFPNPEIQIVAPALWEETQKKRLTRAAKYAPKSAYQKSNAKTLTRNDGVLPLMDVMHCALCGKKMTNGTKYHYWRIKGSEEKRSKKIRAYQCKASSSDAPHPNILLRADWLEPIALGCLAEHIALLQKEESVSDIIFHHYDNRRKTWEAEKKKLAQEITKTTERLQALQECIPDAVSGNFALSIEETASAIRRLEEKRAFLENQLQEKASACPDAALLSGIQKKECHMPTWQEIFINADKETQRVLANKLAERIEAAKEHILIHFRIPEKYFYPE